MRSLVFANGAVLALLLGAAAPVPGQVQGMARRSVFQAAPAAPLPAAYAGERALRRARAVQADRTLLDTGAAARLAALRRTDPRASLPARIEFFPDAAVDVAWTDCAVTGDGKLVWSGKVEGVPHGSAVMVADGGALTGNATRGDGILYQVRTAADGTVWAREIDQNRFPRELPPLRTPPAARERTLSARDAALADDGSIIDVMVVYTAATRQKLGGTDATKREVDLGIAETNQGYANSGVPQRLRLAYTGEVQYVETGDLSTDLQRLRRTDDGYVDDVHRLRDSYSADLVSMWVEGGDACGIAYMLPDPDTPNPGGAFSVVERSCATGYYSFGHELGHNMGASHARDDGTGPGAFPYSYGYKKTGPNAFRTVMAYDTNCAGCPRLNYWSNPGVSVNGVPAGIDPDAPNSAANYLTLINTRNTVANYRTPGGEAGGGEIGGLPESDHPYANNTDRTWTYTPPVVYTSLNVTFDARTSVEPGYDYIHIADAAGQAIAGSPFTGAALSGKTVVVPGATVKIRLVSDTVYGDYGFRVTGVTGNGGGGVTALPRLVATSFTAPTSLALGSRLGIRLSVSNQGNAAAGAFHAGFYFSRSQPVTPADLASDTSCAFSSGLAAGASSTCSGDVTVPAAVTPGVWYVAAIADDRNQVQQSDRSGNMRVADTGAITVTGGVAAELLSPAPGSVLTSANVTFSWTAGTGVAGYSLAIGSTPDGADIYDRDQGTRQSVEVTGLPTNGATLYVRLSSRIGAGTVPRAYTLRAATVATGANLPRLAITEFTAPTSGSAGVNLTGTRMVVANQGAGAAGPFRVAYYFGRQPAVTTADVFSGWLCSVSEGLAAGATFACAGDVGVPNALTPGTWYLAAIADDQQRVPQSDTFGNLRLNDNGTVAITGRAPAGLVSPEPGATLTSGAVTFRWNSGSNPDEYYLRIGAAPGESGIYAGSHGRNLTADVSGLPVDGRTLYVRLLSRFGSEWLFNDYTYRAFNAGAGGAVPRLVVASFTAPTTGVAGVNLSGIRATVVNEGSANAGPFRIGFYYARSEAVTTADVFSGWYCDAGSLGAGNTYTCNGDIGVPADLGAGQWYLAAIADDLNQVPQSGRGGQVRLNDNGRLTIAAGVDAVLKVDGGAFANSIGWGNGHAHVYFVNRLTPPAYPATLKNVQIYFGDRTSGLPVDSSITVVAASNPDGSANFSSPNFARTSAKITARGAFNTFAVDPITIFSGDFLVGFTLDNPVDVYPADNDSESGSQRRSYYSEDGSAFRLMDEVQGLAGNLGIRATVTVAATPAITAFPGTLDFGTVNVGSGKTMQVAVANTGLAGLVIGQAWSSDAQFAVLSWPERVAGGSSARIDVRFTPSGGGASTTTLTIASNDPLNPELTVGLQGSGAAPADTVLKVDAGTFRWPVGWPDGQPNAHFVNRLTPPGYPATLKNVQIYFGDREDGLAANTSITVLAAAHPSGSGNIDGADFARIPARVDVVGGFNTYVVDPITIGGGDFIVGFAVNNPAGVYPSDTDKPAPSLQRSYFSANGTGFSLLDTVPDLSANFGIRATVTAAIQSDRQGAAGRPHTAGESGPSQAPADARNRPEAEVLDPPPPRPPGLAPR